MIRRLFSNPLFRRAILPLAPLSRKIFDEPMTLFFHGVTEKIIDSDIQGVHLDIKTFEAVIHFLRKHFLIIGVDEYVEAVKNGTELPSNAAMLQFDDGYANNLYTVQPFLKALDVPFSVYLSTRHVSENFRFPTYLARVALKYTEYKDFRIHGVGQEVSNYDNNDWEKLYFSHVKEYLKTACLEDVQKMVDDLQNLLKPHVWEEKNDLFSSDQPLSWEEAKLLSERGAVVGAHCHDHCILHAGQPEQEVIKQITLSKSLIEEQLGKCEHFVYPNGSARDVSPFAVKQLAKAGYDSAFTAIPGICRPDMNRYLLPRLCVTKAVCDNIATETSFMFINNLSLQKWQRVFGPS